MSKTNMTFSLFFIFVVGCTHWYPRVILPQAFFFLLDLCHLLQYCLPLNQMECVMSDLVCVWWVDEGGRDCEHVWVFVLVQRVHLNQRCVLKLILVDMLTGRVTVSIECGTTSFRVCFKMKQLLYYCKAHPIHCQTSVLFVKKRT